ncbi:hypothetical protein ABIA54_001735 [Pseudomonas sp. EB276 TE3739]|nr:hypothetical protein [Pseudomonas koreensis]
MYVGAMSERVQKNQPALVGASLLAKAVHQLPFMATDTPDSRASSLPQEIVG